MSETLLPFSVAIAYVLTNIDGLLVFVALATAGKLKRVGVGFLIAQSFVMTVAYAAGAFASSLPVHQVGWLGLVPVFLGVRQLLGEFFTSNARNSKVTDRLLGLAVVFFALSTDTLLLLAAFFADSSKAFDHLVILGALLAVSFLLIAGTFLSRGLGFSLNTIRKLERLTPFVMIMAGIYILMDTGTDAF
ncbi:cadmium resistance transporter [Roseibium sp.]|uniref:cadmium resistance transporter n=1 Tax=Roseibium sp. TaxID=1936156 RepID=UPI003D0ACAE7